MRLRTEERRAAILRVAIELFREVGFARASMAAISARLGGSKGTLYGYFNSKEELFIASMMAVMEDQAQEAVKHLDAELQDHVAVLHRFGRAYLALHLSSDALPLMRAAIAEGGNSKIGRNLYGKGCERAWRQVAAYLGRIHAQGLICATDTRIAAAHLKGLLEAGVVEPSLYGAEPWISADEAVVHAVEAFLKAYSPALPAATACLSG